jgi:hypothetical protein
MTMNIRTYFISTLLLIAVSSPLAMGQVVYLITATDDSYTSDGTNTWNALNETALDTLNTDTALSDTSGSSAAGLVWTVTATQEPGRDMSHDSVIQAPHGPPCPGSLMWTRRQVMLNVD